MGKVPNTSENGARCICDDCPSYPRKGSFYCATGKSEEPIRKKGCVCGDCELFNDFGLVDGYYCVAGAAGEGAE